MKKDQVKVKELSRMLHQNNNILKRLRDRGLITETIKGDTMEPNMTEEELRMISSPDPLGMGQAQGLRPRPHPPAQYGWICPICKRCYSPHVEHCTLCNNESRNETP